MDAKLRTALKEAIAHYDFPPVTYDFDSGREKVHPSMLDVEGSIRAALLSQDPDQVKDGLSNILYWGYYRIGFWDIRVRRFRDGVSAEDLVQARDLFRALKGTGLRAIRKLDLPQFSGMSFVSKLRML